MTQQMKILSAKLENIFCYDQLDIELQNGVSVFAGANGSGKSSFLEALFFVLFGSSTNTITGRSLNEVLRQGEKKGFLEADFEFGKHQYNIHLAIKKTGDRVGADGAHCILKRDDGEEWSGVKNITTQIETLLHMDSEDFANCLYVRQGEVNRLIDASSKDRQSIIDRLLRLTKIDEYEKRLKDAITATNRRKTLLQGSLSTIRQEFEQLEQLNLANEKAQQEKSLAEIARKQQVVEVAIRDEEKQLQSLEDSKANLKQAIEQLHSIRDQYQKDRDELSQRNEAEQSLKDEIAQLETESQEVQTALKAVQQESWWPSNDVEASLQKLIESDQESLKQLDETLQAKRDELTTVKTKRQGQEETLAAVQKELDQRITQIEQHQCEVEAQEKALESLKQNDIDVNADLEQIETELIKTIQKNNLSNKAVKNNLRVKKLNFNRFARRKNALKNYLKKASVLPAINPLQLKRWRSIQVI